MASAPRRVARNDRLHVAVWEAHDATRHGLVIHPPAAAPPDRAPLIPGLPPDLRRWGLEVVQVLLVAGILYLMTTSLVTRPFVVEMTSMQPWILHGDHILIDRLSPRWDEYARGEIVVFDAPAPFDGSGIPYIKRVIGLPGEQVRLENGRVYVTDLDGLTRRLDEPYLAGGVRTLPQDAAGTVAWTVGDGELFLLGDNRPDSVDSRTFGPVERERIQGRAWLRYLPFDRFGVVPDQ